MMIFLGIFGFKYRKNDHHFQVIIMLDFLIYLSLFSQFNIFTINHYLVSLFYTITHNINMISSLCIVIIMNIRDEDDDDDYKLSNFAFSIIFLHLLIFNIIIYYNVLNLLNIKSSNQINTVCL